MRYGDDIMKEYANDRHPRGRRRRVFDFLRDHLRAHLQRPEGTGCVLYLSLSTHSCVLFYHFLHKVPGFFEFICAKSEYVFLPQLLSGCEVSVITQNC